MDLSPDPLTPRPEAVAARHAMVVSIINYRTGPMTIECVQSVLADAGGIDLHVVVVDNASGDGSAEAIEAWIAAQDPPVPVTLVRAPANRGFAAGHNIGLAARSGETYLVHNSDTLVRPGALGILLGTLRARPEAGMVAPQLEYLDGEVQGSAFRLPTPLGEVVRAARSGPVTRLLARHDLSLGPAPDPAAIEWVSFASVLIRAETLATVGPLDEGYFLYTDDVDYCWRARRAGWAIVQDRRARIVHFRGASGSVKQNVKARRRQPAYLYASRARFFRKAYGQGGLLAANLLWYAGKAANVLRCLVSDDRPSGAPREWLDIWTNFLDPLGDNRMPRS
jgi:hypothetical protein